VPTNRRNLPRIHAPKGMIVAWRSGSQQGISKMGTMALGGIFLNTPEPPPVGSALELIFAVSTGTRVRAQAMVRTSRPDQGMGVRFVHMEPEDRSRLNQFLKLHIKAGNIEEDLRTEDGRAKRARKVARQTASRVFGVGCGWGIILVPRQNRANTIVVESPFLRPHVKEGQKRFERHEQIQAVRKAREAKPAVDEKVFEEELKRYVVISEKSTYYGLLGIAGDSDKGGIKQSFYALARKFHPDRHMDSPQCAGALQQ
jgi:PilZ domain/DnaJ domain